MSATVSTLLVRALLLGAAAMGVEVEGVLAALGLTSADLADRDARLPVATSLTAWRLCAERSGDPFFGLHLAERVVPGVYDVVDYAAASAPDLGSALGLVARYQRILDESVTVVIAREGDVVHIGQEHAIARELRCRHAPDAYFALLLLRARALTGAAVAPVAMAFRYPEPEDTSEHRRVFGCPVSFAAPVSRMTIPAAALPLPIASADARLAAVLAGYAESLLASLPGDDLETRARRAIAECLRRGDAGITAVAAHLGMTPRTLQRHLAAAGLHHKQLLEATQKDLALTYLAGDLALAEIAWLLGFSELSAFHRAFKRWTGATPAQARANARDRRAR
jgi:AraC-like DNA-binding protein